MPKGTLCCDNILDTVNFRYFDKKPRLINKYRRKVLTLLDMTSSNEYVLGRGYIAALRYICQSRTNELRSTYTTYVD